MARVATSVIFSLTFKIYCMQKLKIRIENVKQFQARI